MIYQHFGFYSYFCHLIDVSIEVTLTTKAYGSEISWSFGSCNSEQQYHNHQEYNQQCHFNTSPSNWVYKLTCMDSLSDGWHGAFITINGVNYCEDLVGNEKIVYIESNPSKSNHFLVNMIGFNYFFIFVKS